MLVLESHLVLASAGRAPVTACLEPVVPQRGRPRGHYRLLCHRPEDVADAQRLQLPVYLLSTELLTLLGCPVRIPPHLLVDRPLVPAVDTPWVLLPFRDGRELHRARLEDLIVALLKIDALLARRLAVLHRDAVDPVRLARTVGLEGEVPAATRVRLQEIAPQLPRVGRPLPRSSLRRQDRDGVVQGVRA